VPGARHLLSPDRYSFVSDPASKRGAPVIRARSVVGDGSKEESHIMSPPKFTIEFSSGLDAHGAAPGSQERYLILAGVVVT
jgi:hypothetical protein